MDKSRMPVLCGGTFFTLLLQAMRNGLNKRGSLKENGEFSEADVFEALVNIVVGDCERSKDDTKFSPAVSKYKGCKIANSGLFPIHENARISAFVSKINDDYRESLTDMIDFVNKYVDSGDLRKWLVKALLELIYGDVNIAETDMLYISPDGRPIMKSGLRKLTEICFPAFLLGIWHYIIVSKVDNTLGEATYNEWCKPSTTPGQRRLFDSDIGKNLEQIFNLSTSEGSKNKKETVVDDDATVIDEEPTVFHSDTHHEQPEPEPIPNPTVQFVYAPTMFSNSGENNKQIYNVGTINMS
jgi:hypothetical protein